MDNVIRLSEKVLPVYKEFWHSTAVYNIIKGSRGSGKSKQVALFIIYYLMKHPLANALVVRKVYRTLKDSCFSDLQWAMNQLGCEGDWNCTSSPLEITNRHTGQKILFRGLDDGIKVTSVSVAKGVLNIVWFEEFYEITKEADFDIVDESIRGQLPDGYQKKVIGTFNPWNEHHWLKRRFFDNPDDSTYTLTTTYKDNVYLSKDDLALFDKMRERNPRRYKVAGLGEWGIAEGCVYENWEERKFGLDDIRECDTICGLDFGFTNDPTAFLIGFINEEQREIYVWDELYEKGLTNQNIAEKIVRLGYGKEKITADSAEPKSIEELRQLGMRVRAARKGQDSIRNGIQYIQNYKIYVHPRCTNFITEISNYTWEKDRLGNTLNRPVDDFNHLMDALRYSVEQYVHGDNFSFD